MSGRHSPRRRVGRTTEGERRGSSRDAPGSLTTLLLRFSSGKGFDSAIGGDNWSRCLTGFSGAVGYSPERVLGGHAVATHEGIFPTFFLSGFECSTFDWRDRGRRNLVDETRHASTRDEDYALLRGLGIAVAREGIPWPLVERDGQYDFSRSTRSSPP